MTIGRLQLINIGHRLHTTIEVLQHINIEVLQLIKTLEVIKTHPLTITGRHLHIGTL